MNNFFRALIAGYGAKKLGGGCFSTVIIFIIIYSLLGKCGNNSRAAAAPVNGKTELIKQNKNIKVLKPKATAVYCTPKKAA
jgi:hypothetical protein